MWWHCNVAPADAAGHRRRTNIGTDDAAGVTGNNCDNPVNFSRFNDPVINKAFETGRTSTDPAVRKTAYEDINKEFAKQVWEGWGYWSAVDGPVRRPTSTASLGPNLPTATSPDAGRRRQPFTGSVERHRRVGALVEEVRGRSSRTNSARPNGSERCEQHYGV